MGHIAHHCLNELNSLQFQGTQNSGVIAKYNLKILLI